MESRKYQLQKQIIEALKDKDNDLYSLLRTQWAHRFGVESLEELKKIEDILVNEASNNEDNDKNDQAENNIFEVEKENLIKDDDNKEKEIKNKEVESIIDENNQDFKIKSYEIADNKNNEKKPTNSAKDHTSRLEIKALIPLPPKPKYSYLKKWLLRK